MPSAVEPIRTALKVQYHAALAMLRQAVELCPDELWTSSAQINAPWQMAYHTLFFTHLYLQPTDDDFRPWLGHQAGVQNPDGIGGPDDPSSGLPLLPDPYSREQVLAYWAFVDEMVDGAVDAMDVLSPESGFSRYPIPKLEHQIANIRHAQHGAAHLAARLRAALDLGIDWVETL